MEVNTAELFRELLNVKSKVDCRMFTIMKNKDLADSTQYFNTKVVTKS